MTVSITAAHLRAIAGGKAPLADRIAESFNAMAPAYGITTPLRLAHFFAQLSHESGGFRYSKEVWGPTAAQKRYEGRRDLGNTQPGDGARFKGRGPMQVTGRANYRDLTAWLRSRSGAVAVPDFEAEPERLEEFPWAILGAIWFWDTRRLNALADADNVLAITKKINGGTNGLADRKAALVRAKAALGVTAERAPSSPRSAKPRTDRMNPSARQWAEDALPPFEVKAIQERLVSLGYHTVGIPDGIWGDRTTSAIKALQEQASRANPAITADGHYGPQTRQLLSDDLNRAVVSETRKSVTASDLAKIGTPAVVDGRRIQWSSVISFVTTLFGVAMLAFQNYQAGTDTLPWAVQAALNFMPPWVAMIAPMAVAVYNAAVAKGLIGSAVERVREGIDNSGLPPAQTGPGGLFGSLFGRG